MQPGMTESGLGRRDSVGDGAEVLVQSDFDTADEAILLLQLMPDKPYVLVPSTVAPGVEAPFEVRCAVTQ
jgi:hypothetical protein